MSTEIDPSTCSDEDIILFIEQVRGEDARHYKADWIIIRSLKILVRDYLERKEFLKEVQPIATKIEDILTAGILTDKEKKELDEL